MYVDTSRSHMSGAYFQLHKIANNLKRLTTHACQTIVHAPVTSRLDYGNAVLFVHCASLAAGPMANQLQDSSVDLSRVTRSHARVHY